MTTHHAVCPRPIASLLSLCHFMLGHSKQTGSAWHPRLNKTPVNGRASCGTKPRVRMCCSHGAAARRRAAAGRGRSLRQLGRRARACVHPLRRRGRAARRGGAAAVRGAPPTTAPSARPTRQPPCSRPRSARAHPERSAGTRWRVVTHTSCVSPPHMFAQRSRTTGVSGCGA